MIQVASVNNEGLSTFVFSGKEVRVVGTPEIPMFVAKDIVDAVSAVWNGSAAISHIPDDFKGVRSVLTPSGEQKMLCLTEAGLNMYLFRSDKPAALPFQRKIAEEVLPSIRKHGVYATPQTIESMLADPDFAIQTFQKLKEERTRRIAAEEEAALNLSLAVTAKKETADKQKQLVEQQPKVNAWERLLSRRGYFLWQDASLKLGLPANKLAQLMREWKLIAKDNRPTHKLSGKTWQGNPVMTFEETGEYGGKQRSAWFLTPAGMLLMDHLLDKYKVKRLPPAAQEKQTEIDLGEFK